MIIITASFTAEPIQYVLDFLLEQYAKPTYQILYDQVFQQLLVANSAVRQNTKGLNIFLIRMADFVDRQDGHEFSEKLMHNVDELIRAFRSVKPFMKVPCLIILCPSYADTDRVITAFTEAEKKLYHLQENDPQKQVSIISLKEIEHLYPVEKIFNVIGEKYAHIPYTLEFYTALGTVIARRYYAWVAKPYKVIVLDCDGVLWKGVIEEDGLEGIAITRREQYLQDFVLNQYRQGMLLCLCSKNTEKSVLSVFNQHPGMILNLDKHIVSYRINWKKKSENLLSLSRELNVGLESFVLIDDNPLECAEVRAACPAVLTIALPKTLHQSQQLLNHIWAFDHLQRSLEDSQRTTLYKQNVQREHLLAKTVSYSEFLNRLNVKVTTRIPTSEDFPRIVQMIRRTNQFNLNPGWLSDAEIPQKIQQQEGLLIVSARDKFGDYGVIGLAVYEECLEELQIKTFLLSCRALGKGIEHEMLHQLAGIAKKKKLTQLKLYFSITGKNEPAINFLKTITHTETIQQAQPYLLLTVIDAESAQFNAETLSATNPPLSPETQNITFHSKIDFIQKASKYFNTVSSILSQLHQKNKKTKKITQMFQSHDHQEWIKWKVLSLLEKYELTPTNEHSSLVACGINSLTAVLIAAEIDENWRLEINYLDLLDKNFTTSALIEKISAHEISANNPEIQKSALDSQKDFYPLSFAQQRLWLDEQIEPNTAKNNITVALKIAPNVDDRLLKLCFQQLIQRHDSLRFCFFFENECAYIRLKNIQELDFDIHHCLVAGKKELKAEIEKISQRPFNLSQWPLFRVILLKTADTGEAVLVFNIHHIIHDGWSLHLLLKELSLLYDGYSQHMIPVLKPARSYIDFILWQQQQITPEILDRQKQFWQENFKESTHLNLIYDYKTDENITTCGRTPFKLSHSLSRRLTQLAQQNQSTVYEILLAAFNIFLSTVTYQTEISIITAVSGRHYPQTTEMIGLFVNLLILHTTIGNQDTVLQLLNKNKLFLNQVLSHQDLPYPQIIHAINPESKIKSASKIHAGFFFQNYPQDSLIMNGVKSEIIFSNSDAIIYDDCTVCRFGNLVLFAQERDQQIHCLFEYNRSLFKPRSIRRMIQSFKILLANIVDNMNQSVFDIALIDRHTQDILLNKFNAPITPYPESLHLIKFFQENVTHFPHKLAIRHDQEALSYLALEQVSNQLAHYLQKQYVELETPVGIYLPKGLQWIISMLAITKAGGCYVPLDPEIPDHRIQQIVEDARISFIITKSHLPIVQKLTPSNIQFIFMDQSHFLHEPTTALDYSNIGKHHLAYIMYTSGSTGQPKGVMIEHQSIIRLVKSTNYVDICSEDNVAQTANLAFDAATFEIWGALLNGATLEMVDNDIVLNIQSFSHFLSERKITILFLTTQLFHVYAFSKPSIFGQLKYLVVGGDVLIAESVNIIMSMLSRPKFFINGYGPTENTTFSSAYILQEKKNIKDPVSIGKPISGTNAYILNQNFHLKPIHTPGRLFLGGLGVARGYLNRKELNVDKFIQNPYCPNDILYDTGDIAAWLPDGNLKFMGRMDSQIKILGYRIELSEIESKLIHHPAIKQALVLPKEDGHQKRLAAYILLNSGEHLLEADLYQYLKNQLPKYMIPSLYCFVNKFPINQSGKIDKSALLELTLLPHVDTHEPPQNVMQNELAEIFSKILNLDINTLSIHASFFDLGGDSLSAIRLMNDIYVKFLVKINISALYEFSNIKRLSNYITSFSEKETQSKSGNLLEPYESFTLMQIKKGSDNNNPFIFISPLGGTGFRYLDLIRHLPDDQPCFVIQDPSIDADRILFKNIPEIAAYYRQIIFEKLQPSKPVVLAGFSFGGMLCLEIVHQLEKLEQSDQVSLLVILDTWIMADVQNEPIKEAIKSTLLHQYDHIMRSLMKQNIDPKPWMELNYTYLQHLGFSFKPAKINKNILLFKAMELSENFVAIQEPTNYLRYHTKGQVEVHLVPGNHDTILQPPNVKNIAEYLKSINDLAMIT